MKRYHWSCAIATVSCAIIFLLGGARGLCATQATGHDGIASNNITVSLSPQQSFIAPTEICTLQVAIEEPYDSLGCMECHISFDTTLVTLLAAEEGQLFEKAGTPTFFRWESSSADTHSVVDCLLGYRTYFLPPGELARFIFRGDQNGTCPVHITYVRLWDIDRIEFFPVVDPAAWIYIGTTTGAHPPACEPVHMTSYPNPFNASTTITVPQSSGGDLLPRQRVTISVYNARGQRMTTLYDGIMEQGENRFVWEGIDHAGRNVPSGIYFVEAKTPRAHYRTKVVFIQ